MVVAARPPGEVKSGVVAPCLVFVCVHPVCVCLCRASGGEPVHGEEHMHTNNFYPPLNHSLTVHTMTTRDQKSAGGG